MKVDAAQMALSMILRMAAQRPADDPFVAAVVAVASEALSLSAGERPSSPQLGLEHEAPPKRGSSTDRWRRWKERQEALANALANAPPTPTNALANVGANADGTLSLLSDLKSDQEIQRDREGAQTPTLTNANANAANAPQTPTRIKHKFANTLAPDPDGDAAVYATWCIQWGFVVDDEGTRKMARHYYGIGKPWRDWRAALRNWMANERPSGSYQARKPDVQPVPATGRIWKVGQ